jgi:hypothetical protein
MFQIQSSRTALSCSRKWMSGHAAALAEPKRIDSGKSTGHTAGSTVMLQETPSGSVGDVCFPS